MDSSRYYGLVRNCNKTTCHDDLLRNKKFTHTVAALTVVVRVTVAFAIATVTADCPRAVEVAVAAE